MRNVIFVRSDNCIFRSFRILEGLFWGILIFCNLMIASDVFADTWFVNASAVGDNNGTSWANAYTDIQTAIGAASEEDEIWVAAGTYTSTRDNVIKIKSKHGVALYGGFDGTENQRNERDPAVNTTTIDGEGARRGIHITSSTDIIFDGFTITNGHIISKGGGLYNDGIHGIIKNITINNCIFSGNHTDGVGGGVCNEYGNPTVSNCIFRGNSADYGGGIYNRSNDESIIINCSFSGNSAEDGGGMFNDSTSPTVSNCFFIGNSAQDGGGMNNFSASPTVSNCFFTGNSAQNGGGMFNDWGSPTVSNCSFIGNSAQNGGGMFNDWNSPTVSNCTFIRNSADDGGGMFNNECWSLPSPMVSNCTFSENSASDTGGGMYDDSSGIKIANSIFWDNTADTDGNEAYSDSWSTSKFSCCCIKEGVPAGGTDDGTNITDDPKFSDDGSLHLTSSSPCIDAGNKAYAGSIETDMDGESRFFDGSGDGTATIDIGADEFFDTDGDGLPNYEDMDDDGDGVIDSEDAAPLDSSDTTSTLLPSVVMVTVNDVSPTSAIAVGYISDVGTSSITAHGFCWNTTGTPTISDAKTDGGSASSTGVFSAHISGLTENTTYYIRAFATNDTGTGYGSSISFTTLTTDSGNSGDTDEPEPEPDEQLEEAIDDALYAIDQSGNVVESVLEALDLAVGMISSGDIDTDDALDAFPLTAKVLAYLETLTNSGYEVDAETLLAILASTNEIATAALADHKSGQTLTSYELTLILRQSTAVIDSLGALVQTLDFDDRLEILDQARTILVSGITAGLAASDMDTDTLSSLVDTISDLVSACMADIDAQGCAELIGMAKETILEAVEAALAPDAGSAGREIAREIANEVRLICDAVYDFLTGEASAGSAVLSRNRALAAGSVAAMDSEETDENLTLSGIRDLTGDIAEMLSPFTENDLTLSNRLVNSVVELLDLLYEAGIDPLAEALEIETSRGVIAGDEAELISALADAPDFLGQLLDSFAATISCSIDRQDLAQALEADYTAEQAAALEEALPALVDFNQALLTRDSQAVIDTLTRALGLYYPDDVVSVTGNLDTSLTISLAGEDGSTLGEVQTVMVSEVRLVPSIIPDGVYILGDDDRRLLVSAPLAVTIAPVFSDTCDAMLALLDYDYPVALETDGRFTIAFDDATTLCAMTGYGLSQRSDEGGSGILFKAKVDDPASETYKIAINYADSTTQDMVPAVLDLDILKNYFNNLNVTFSIDRDSGIFTLGDGCTYRPGFWITALTEDDLSYFNEHQVSGAAFRLAGNNIEFISATGKQVFYFLGE